MTICCADPSRCIALTLIFTLVRAELVDHWLLKQHFAALSALLGRRSLIRSYMRNMSLSVSLHVHGPCPLPVPLHANALSDGVPPRTSYISSVAAGGGDLGGQGDGGGGERRLKLPPPKWQ